MGTQSTTRERGFAPWSPRKETLILISAVRAILTEYAAYLPLTLRQIFYRLVGAHGYEKNERAYKRLGEHLNRARRARLISFEAIRDDGITIKTPHCWDNAAELVRAFVSETERFRLDRQKGQPRRLFLACEAAGMVPQLERIAAPFGIEVMSGGGFDSVTAKHSLAERLADLDAAEVLHIGDHDPSGVHMFLSFCEDCEEFIEEFDPDADVTFTRLAVTPAQIRQHGLPTAPPKETDKRRFSGETTQVESLPPDSLAAIISNAITERIDQDVFDKVIAEEKRVKTDFRKTLIPTLRRLSR